MKAKTKYVVTGNFYNEEEHRFPLSELAGVTVDQESDAESVLILIKDNREVINCDFFNIEKE